MFWENTSSHSRVRVPKLLSHKPHVRRSQEINVRRVLRFILEKGIAIDLIREHLVILVFIVGGLRLFFSSIGHQIELLRVHVDAGEFDAAMRHIGVVVRQVLDNILYVPRRLRISILRQLGISRPFEGGRMRRLVFPVKRCRPTILRAISVRIRMLVPDKMAKSHPLILSANERYKVKKLYLARIF